MREALAGLLAIAVLALAGCGSAASEAGPDGYRAGQTHDPYPVPTTPLTDTEGKPYSLADDTHKPLTLVFFGYTHCPDTCQTVMSTITTALARLSDADRRQVGMVFVTSDPARDTGPVLRRYLDHFGTDFVGLTGSLPTIAAVGRPLAVYVAQGERLPSGGRDLNSHSSQITGIIGNDTAPILWTQETSSADLAADIHTLLSKD